MFDQNPRGDSPSARGRRGRFSWLKRWAPRALAATTLMGLVAGMMVGAGLRAEASASAESLDLQAAQTVVFAASDDSFTNKNAPSRNFGGNAELRLDATPPKITWLKFTVSGVTAPVARARVRLYATNGSPVGGDLYSVSDNNWSEGRINWSNQPAIDGPKLASVARVQAGNWYEWDVSAFVTGNGTYTFALQSTNGDAAGFRSAEAGSRPPKLAVELGSGSSPTQTPGPTATSAPLTSTPVATDLPSPTPTSDPGSGVTVRFAVIGDFGSAGPGEADVANRVKSWNPDFIITTGDNNYPDGAASTIDANIGQYYHSFISPYTGTYGAGADTNRFFPSLGNHDWHVSPPTPYLNYFTLPGNERYYDFTRGPVHFYALDSDSDEPDGNTSTSVQARWLQNRLAASTSCWDIVYLHHAPYSSGSNHGSSETMQWPYPSWGADAVMAGHDHTYERIIRSGFPYFVNGLGGKNEYGFGTPISGSVVRYNADLGAMLVEASRGTINYKFITRTGALIDDYTATKNCP